MGSMRRPERTGTMREQERRKPDLSLRERRDRLWTEILHAEPSLPTPHRLSIRGYPTPSTASDRGYRHVVRWRSANPSGGAKVSVDSCASSGRGWTQGKSFSTKNR